MGLPRKQAIEQWQKLLDAGLVQHWGPVHRAHGLGLSGQNRADRQQQRLPIGSNDAVNLIQPTLEVWDDCLNCSNNKHGNQ